MQTDDRTNHLRLTVVYALALGVFAALCRLAPYYLPGDKAWNLAPVGALALFAGSRLRGRWAYLVPLGAMLISDLLLLGGPLGGKTFSWGTPVLYASFAAYVLLGRLIRQDSLSPVLIGGSALAVGSSRVDLQACKLEYSIVSPK